MTETPTPYLKLTISENIALVSLYEGDKLRRFIRVPNNAMVEFVDYGDGEVGISIVRLNDMETVRYWSIRNVDIRVVTLNDKLIYPTNSSYAIITGEVVRGDF